MIFGGVYTPEWSLQGRCRRFRAVFFPCPTPKQAINPRQPCEKRHFCRLGQNNENVQVATQQHFFRSSLDAQHTHQRTSRHRFSSACQLRGEQITQVRIVMSAEHGRFCGCVKPTCFSRFREGSHTRANFQMRSMGIYSFFSQRYALMRFFGIPTRQWHFRHYQLIGRTHSKKNATG